ncbi:hypothetical protein HHK36_028307 [Tetracentron sinense]|uniref:Uncharacterized protein n=1 Tax=Tetracentron sinense TaxID=13715 RepID=A0A834YEM1_TETSI|nr:hypothetical protein HHK36_028307 [Tetracentron sinense]
MGRVDQEWEWEVNDLECWTRLKIVVILATVQNQFLLSADVRTLSHTATHPAKAASAPDQFLPNAAAPTSPTSATNLALAKAVMKPTSRPQ